MIAYEDMFPWLIADEHLNAPDVRMLRLEQRRRGGGELEDDELAAVSDWQSRLRAAGKVITYSTERGFEWVDRLPSDDDMIRRPR